MAWDETTGVPEVDEQLQINPFRRKRLLEAIDGAGAGADDGVEHRISDDAHGNGRSGGPAPLSSSSVPSSTSAIRPQASYEDPGQGHLKDLIAQQEKLSAPQPKPGIGHRLLRAMMDAGPTLLASATGSAGGAVGADQRMEEGVKRRHEVADRETRDRVEQQKTLREAIELEQRGEDQRTFQHGEDQEKLRVQEEGMSSRAKMAEAAEDARSRRLEASISARQGLQDDKFKHDDEMEDRKQVGRMQLQHARQTGAESVARIRAAAPKSVPPVLGKAVDTFEDSQSRLDVMQKSYDAATKDPGNQQAMLNLLSNHLGMTMGLQKGARLNQSLIDEAKRSGYLDERAEAHFGPDGYMTGVVLTPRQMGQMMYLAQDRIIEDSRKVQELEGYFGVQGKTRLTPRIPGQGTPSGPGAGRGGGAGPGGAGATPGANSAPKTAEELLRKRKQAQQNAATTAN